MHHTSIFDKGVWVLDGATGTELAKRGLPGGVCPEAWVLEHPEALHDVQSRYEEAGTQIVYAPTFGANRLKLKEFGLESRAVEFNCRLAEISRRGVRSARVFGDLAPTGHFVEPFGDLPFEEAVAVYKEQVRGLLEGGVDGFAIETMMDLQESRAALIAVRELSDLPVIVTLTFSGDRTLTGASPEAAVVTLQALGASAVGCNCSSGPEQMASVITAMRRCARVPLVAKPNAGMPKYVDGRTVFEMGGVEFGEKASRLVACGASVVGGCCGTTPEHIRELAARVRELESPFDGGTPDSYVCGVSDVIRLSSEEPFCVIGERLNPTGKKALQAELRAGKLDLVRKMAREQKEAGARLLDVNCGLPGIDEPAMIRRVVALVSGETGCPLCIDTLSPEAVEAALRLYPGRALFNSISAENVRLERVLPIVAKYGAAIIALPLDDAGIPETVEGRARNVERILKAAEGYGYSWKDLVVDGLVMTVSANPEAARLTLDTIEWVSRRNGCSVCGLSNVSFGLPRRDLINRAFLCAAIGRGLTMAIANPMNTDIMESALASDVLFGRDAQALHFIGAFSASTDAAAAPPPSGGAPATTQTAEDRAYRGVLEGNEEGVLAAIEELLAAGRSAGSLVDSILIPAITAVGERYERKEYFLPQLMLGAQAMKSAMRSLEPLLEGDSEKKGAGRIILATVKGDIHDIGKNIVVLMLKNYGFEVIDLGKDVPAETILDTAMERHVDIIGLSALMTTTMGEMKHVVELARSRGYGHLRFIVGGAVVDEEFAKSIGAEYGADAMDTVRIAQRLSLHKEDRA